MTNKIESPTLSFRSGDKLPNYLLEQDGGLLVIDGEKKLGPFSAVYDFKHRCDSLRSEVPKDKAWTKNPNSYISFEVFDNPEISEAMKVLTELNRMSTGGEDDLFRFAYQTALNKSFLPVIDKTRSVFNEKAVVLPPLNGGRFVRAIFQSAGAIKGMERIMHIELKRILMSNGGLLVGVIENKISYPDMEPETGIVLDDCMAAEVSASVSIDLQRKRYPSIKEWQIIVSPATQRGAEQLVREWGDHNVEVKFVGSVPVRKMNNRFYLERTEDEGYPAGTQFVGDIGARAGKLPDYFNSIAPWNEYNTSPSGVETATAKKQKRIHIICPVRGVTEEQQREIDEFTKAEEENGNIVHNPKRDVDQSDPTGYNICIAHLKSMKEADEVVIFYSADSMGSHFDLGISFALSKRLKLVKVNGKVPEGKGYIKVIYEVIRRQELKSN